MSDDEPKGAQIIDLADALKRSLEVRPPLHHERRVTTNTCRHNYAKYDHNARRVWCADCGEVLDPFDVLRKVTKEWDRFMVVKSSLERAESRLNQVLTEERRAKARLARARKKLDEKLAQYKELLERTVDDGR